MNMGTLTHNLKHFVTAACFCAAVALSALVLSARPASAQDGPGEDLPGQAVAPSLEALMDQLAHASPEEAPEVARQVERLWRWSGSDALDLLLERGRAAMDLNDYATALDHLTALTDHAPEFAEGWTARALALFALGHTGPAIEDLERALALNPSHYETMIGLAVVFEQVDMPAKAYEVYQRVLVIHPHHADAQKALARLERGVKGVKL